MKRKISFESLRLPCAVFLFFVCLYGLSMGGHGYGGVGTTTYAVTRAMLLEGRVAIEPVPWGKFGQDGHFYAQYGLGHSLFNIPFYLLGHLAATIVPGLMVQYDRVTMFTTLLGQPLISALTCVLLFLLCRRMGYRVSAALSCTLLYGLGTQAWMYAQLDFSEPILTFFLLSAVYWLYVGSHGGTPGYIMIAGLCLSIAITVKIVALIVLPVCLAYLWFGGHRPRCVHSCWKSCLALLLPVLCVGIGTVALYNSLRFGVPWETGYDNELNGAVRHVLQQFWNNLFSLQGSIIFYSPVIVFAAFGLRSFFRRYGAFAWFVGGMIGSFFCFYPFSTNELYYGPRYLTPTLPFFMLIVGAFLNAAPGVRRFRGPLRLLLIVGIMQQLLGVVVNYHTYYWRIQYTLPRASDALRHSTIGQALIATPDLPPVLGHLWLLRQAVAHLFTPDGLPVSGVRLLTDTGQHNAWLPYYGLDLWWLNPQLLHLAGWPVLLVVVGGGLSLMGIALFVIVQQYGYNFLLPSRSKSVRK